MARAPARPAAARAAASTPTATGHPAPPALPAGWPCLRAVAGAPGACVLDISAQPGAKATQVDGWHDGALRLRLAAPPVDGKANEALIAWLAEAIGCTRRELQLLRGQTARRKQLRIERSPAELAAWLQRQGLAPLA